MVRLDYHACMETGARGASVWHDQTGDDGVAAAMPSAESLQAENLRLRERLDSLLREARLNEEKMRRFDQLERKVIGASSLAELVQTLVWEYKALFELDAVTLALVDPEQEVAQILAAPGQTPLAFSLDGVVFLPGEQSLQELYARPARPVLAPLRDEHAMLLQGQGADLCCVALLPLVHRGRFLGSLNLGSRDAARFVPGSSTDFLDRMASLVAVCLDSAIATERLKQAGLTDILTGVNNRRYFESRCLEEVMTARRSRMPLVCLFLDIDHFKKLNDGLGHQAGDEVLRYVASLIKAQLRGNDVVARYGGEEFVVLLPGTTRESGLETAERIRRVVEAQSMPVPASDSARVTISIGVAMLQTHEGKEPSALAADMLARADQALYAAKESGRNRVMADAPSD